MKLTRLLVAWHLLFWLTPVLCAGTAVEAFPDGALVVVVVSQFPPTVMEPEESGHTKPLIVHPGKRAKVVGSEWDRGRKLIKVQWEEQYWQEWTHPGGDGYLDTNRWFMAQSGNWIKWKSFTTAIHPENLQQVEWLPGGR